MEDPLEVESESFTPKRVVDKRILEDGSLQYLFEWVGSSSTENTWEKLEDLSGTEVDCKALIEEYENNIKEETFDQILNLEENLPKNEVQHIDPIDCAEDADIELASVDVSMLDSKEAESIDISVLDNKELASNDELICSQIKIFDKIPSIEDVEGQIRKNAESNKVALTILEKEVADEKNISTKKTSEDKSNLTPNKLGEKDGQIEKDHESKPKQMQRGIRDLKIENILDKRHRNDMIQFLVKWKGYDFSDNTWENEKELNCAKLISKFEKRKKQSSTSEEDNLVSEDDDDDQSETQLYTVDKITDKKYGIAGEILYLVLWKHKKKEKSTWEVVENLNCEDLIQEFEDTFNFTVSQIRPSSDDAIESFGNENYLEVQKLIEKRVYRSGVEEYLVKWKGLDDDDMTWEDAMNLNCENLMDDFDRGAVPTIFDEGEISVIWKHRKSDEKQVIKTHKPTSSKKDKRANSLKEGATGENSKSTDDAKNNRTNLHLQRKDEVMERKKKYPVSNPEILKYFQTKEAQSFFTKIYLEEIQSQRHDIVCEMFSSEKLDFGVDSKIFQLSQIQFLEDDGNVDMELWKIFLDLFEQVDKTCSSSFTARFKDRENTDDEFSSNNFRNKYAFHVLVPEGIIKYLQLKFNIDEEKAEYFFLDADSRINLDEVNEFDKELNKVVEKEKAATRMEKQSTIRITQDDSFLEKETEKITQQLKINSKGCKEKGSPISLSKKKWDKEEEKPLRMKLPTIEKSSKRTRSKDLTSENNDEKDDVESNIEDDDDIIIIDDEIEKEKPKKKKTVTFSIEETPKEEEDEDATFTINKKSKKAKDKRNRSEDQSGNDETNENEIYRNTRKRTKKSLQPPIEMHIKQFKCNHCSYKNIYRFGLRRHLQFFHSKLMKQTRKLCPTCKEGVHDKKLKESSIAEHPMIFLNQISQIQMSDVNTLSSLTQPSAKKRVAAKCLSSDKHEDTIDEEIIIDDDETDLPDENLSSCNDCDFYTYEKSVLDEHIAERHSGMTSLQLSDKKELECSCCTVKAFSLERIQKHMIFIHKISRKKINQLMNLECSCCEFQTTVKDDMNSHMKQSHKIADDKLIHLYYQESSSLAFFFNDEGNSPSTIDKLKSKTYPLIDKISFQNHNRPFIKELKLEYDDDLVENQEQKDKQKEIKISKKLISEDTPLQQLSNKQDDRNDTEKRQKEKICSYCDYETKWSSTLKRHIRKRHAIQSGRNNHNEEDEDEIEEIKEITVKEKEAEKKLVCLQCEYKTDQKDSLKRHIEKRHAMPQTNDEEPKDSKKTENHSKSDKNSEHSISDGKEQKKESKDTIKATKHLKFDDDSTTYAKEKKKESKKVTKRMKSDDDSEDSIVDVKATNMEIKISRKNRKQSGVDEGSERSVLNSKSKNKNLKESSKAVKHLKFSDDSEDYVLDAKPKNGDSKESCKAAKRLKFDDDKDDSVLDAKAKNILKQIMKSTPSRSKSNKKQNNTMLNYITREKIEK